MYHTSAILRDKSIYDEIDCTFIKLGTISQTIPNNFIQTHKTQNPNPQDTSPSIQPATFSSISATVSTTTSNPSYRSLCETAFLRGKPEKKLADSPYTVGKYSTLDSLCRKRPLKYLRGIKVGVQELYHIR